ncbi:MAG: ABC transporter permease [Sandaracinus sp.]|nr:ABC transporter permease [Sandaracinus sp.]MCB9624640.1 ABC transporter permease [Sandaracinus sp.]MCB9632779.1 ABC transporter permease [Sandaracinus sp.]
MKLAFHLAWRFLREGRAQSILILLGVTIGVAAYVFVSSIIASLQKDLLTRTLGTQAQIVVSPPEPEARPLRDDAPHFARRVEPPEPRRRPFDGWLRRVRELETNDEVTAVCPKVTGPALASRGAAERAVLVVGADPTRLRQIVDLASKMREGSYRTGGDQALVGDGLADELGLRLGAPFRVTTDRGPTTLRVAGIFDSGAGSLDEGWVVTSLRTAQTITGRPGDVTEIDLRVADVYEAESLATSIAASTGLEAVSWMERNRDLLTALKSQDQSSTMIRVFVMLAVAMGIASVLVVSVVQRRGQIGILRAIGASRRLVLGVFLLQGAIFGVFGAMFGIGLGAAFAKGLGNVTLFAIELDPAILVGAALISLATGLVSALLPARRAARLDPATAIRGDG